MVLVTGGTGLIGSFLIKELLKEGNRIKALYRNSIPDELQSVPNLTWVKGDILDSALLELLVQDVDQVYHCAGLVSYAPQDANLLKEINIIGTSNVVDACLDKPGIKLCHVSSIAAIGHVKGKQVFNENTKWEASSEHSVYASSKYFGELEVWRGIAEGLQGVIVNPSVVLGPTLDWSRSSTQLFKYVFEERAFYTKGCANFVDVRDVVAAMVKLMNSETKSERFILNAGLLSYKEFFNLVADCFKKKSPQIRVPNMLAEIVWRTEHLRSLITGKKPLITKETARISKKQHLYSNDKIKEVLRMEFQALPETIRWCCQELKKLHTEI
ncbi:NAD-dependent epimerase/dehydratase family protein [Adhaeribacter aquaticus]|uniref:NAD-dependent epimerase/dehydratase family protein n=1 Tax=Adhaeribacter aquaticus TaxID=299567 RepID=UPI000551DE07|nr:NAD-dependent epimerase/dehydratase family protein [Adhaeribacter aquaticus]